MTTTTPEPRILSNEAEFLASERAVALLRAECDGLYASMPAGRDEGDLDLIRKLETQIEAIKKIEDEHYLAIAASPPPTLSTAILKMRLALDPVLGIEESSAPEEVQSLRQALGFFRGPDQTPFAELWKERTRILAAESTLDDGEALELLYARRDVIEEEVARRIVSDPADLLFQMLLLKNWTVERSVDFMHETFVENLIAGVHAIAEKGRSGMSAADPVPTLVAERMKILAIAERDGHSEKKTEGAGRPVRSARQGVRPVGRYRIGALPIEPE